MALVIGCLCRDAMRLQTPQHSEVLNDQDVSARCITGRSGGFGRSSIRDVDLHHDCIVFYWADTASATPRAVLHCDAYLRSQAVSSERACSRKLAGSLFSRNSNGTITMMRRSLIAISVIAIGVILTFVVKPTWAGAFPCSAKMDRVCPVPVLPICPKPPGPYTPLPPC
jgi:hypothetical protein